MAVVMETTIGDLTIDLYVEKRPKACLNFLKLCKLKYYNFNLFHTIQRDFIAQSGDPSGNGNGGESIWSTIDDGDDEKRYFEAEYLPKIRHSQPGLLSMVSSGNNLIGSQFFITLGSDLTSLDGLHCVIGEITEGHDVLRNLNETICDNTHRPFQDVRITHTIILEDPYDDPRDFRAPSQSPLPSAERLMGGRIGADEIIDDLDGKTEIEVQEMLQDREAKARATILEIVGDLPDADVAPPENVLFVCKLNPVTTDNDLEIIFSRFGKVKNCEVIRDRITGDSLQYAFVEFEDSKICENAYFKMDNVLIDDRRIHVDFSQSVAKVQWKGKGKGIIYKDKNSKGGRLNFSNLRDNHDDNDNRKYRKSKHNEYNDGGRTNRRSHSKSPSNIKRQRGDAYGMHEKQLSRESRSDNHHRSNNYYTKDNYYKSSHNKRNDDYNRNNSSSSSRYHAHKSYDSSSTKHKNKHNSSEDDYDNNRKSSDTKSKSRKHSSHSTDHKDSRKERKYDRDRY